MNERFNDSKEITYTKRQKQLTFGLAIFAIVLTGLSAFVPFATFFVGNEQETDNETGFLFEILQVLTDSDTGTSYLIVFVAVFAVEVVSFIIYLLIRNLNAATIVGCVCAWATLSMWLMIIESFMVYIRAFNYLISLSLGSLSGSVGFYLHIGAIMWIVGSVLSIISLILLAGVKRQDANPKKYKVNIWRLTV